jgi:hypothetical protein
MSVADSFSLRPSLITPIAVIYFSMVVLIRKANAVISRQSIKIIHPRERFFTVLFTYFPWGRATVLCCPKDNHRCNLSYIPGKDEPSSRFRHAGQSAASARFDCSKSICPQHHYYENDNFLHHGNSYKLSQRFLISLPEKTLLFK